MALFVGDVLRLPFRDAALDAVVCFGVLHHIAHWWAALTEIARVLKGGGRFFLEEFYPPVYQNFLAQRLFEHPTTPMFDGKSLRQYLQKLKLPLKHTLELKMLGLLGVAVKEGEK
jgi:ubiquinone/menaquinone biosynthesis C-methylase UbiE